MINTEKNNLRNNNLDLLRLFAASQVMLSHLISALDLHIQNSVIKFLLNIY